MITYLGIFFLIAAAQGLFFSLIHIGNFRNCKAPTFLLSFIILCFSISLIESGLWWSNKIGEFVHFIAISEPMAFLFGPLVYFYFGSTFTKIRFTRSDVLHFLPFILCFIYNSQFYFNPATVKTAMLNGTYQYADLFKYYISSSPILVLKAISLLGYSFATYYFFSSKVILKGVKTWFHLAFGVFILYIFSFILFHLLSVYNIIGGCADYAIGVSMSMFIYLFACFGWVRPAIFEGYTVSESFNHIIKEPVKKEISNKQLVLKNRLLEVMETEHLYKCEDVSLSSLALHLGVPRHILSQAINSTGMTFFELINHWRIEEAKKILGDTTKKEFNIIQIAYEVGFGNKVSFNRFFKKATGLTPTEFRKEKRQAP